MKLKKRYIFLSALGAFLLLCGFVLSWGLDIGRFFTDPEDRIFNTRLKWALIKGETEIPLQDLTYFEWDEVCPFLSYSLPWFADNAEKAGTPKELYGVKILNNIPNLNNDGMWALLFKNKKNKTGYIFEVRPRSFSRKKEPDKCYASNAKFVVLDEVHYFRAKTFQYEFLSIRE